MHARCFFSLHRCAADGTVTLLKESSVQRFMNPGKTFSRAMHSSEGGLYSAEFVVPCPSAESFQLRLSSVSDLSLRFEPDSCRLQQESTCFDQTQFDILLFSIHILSEETAMV